MRTRGQGNMKDEASKKPQPRRTVRINGPLLALTVAVVVAIGFLAARAWFAPAETSAEQTTSIGGPFTLVDQNGRTVTDQDFRGKWMLVYFGYTFCPDVCPTALGRNASAIDLLGEKAEKIVPVLITVDPARDTPQALKDYVAAFHPRMVGLSGSQEQITTVAREYRVYFGKVPGNDPDSYLMDHTSFSYLIAPDGHFVQFFRDKLSPEEVADSLNRLM
jgi:cytochrome oxidase Cu insertion factor (SCO1/SenC/PrrC family)